MADAETAPLDALRARAQEWLAPIPGAAPGGASARLEIPYQNVAGEVAKLDAPAGGEVDWKKVVAGAGDLLKTRTKDLTLAAYLARALQGTDGFAGLGVGLTMYTRLLEEFWETAFPELKRLRGRANATQWLVEKLQAAVAATPPKPSDLPALTAAEAAARRMAEVVRSRLADAAPALGPLVEALERARATAEEAQPPKPAAPPPPPEVHGDPVLPPTGAPNATPAPMSPPPAPAAPPAAGAPIQPPTVAAPPPGVEGASDYLRETGTALASVAAALRRADATDATAYRVLRAGLWMHLVQPPPATGGKTSVPPPPENLRNSLGLMLQNQRWMAVLEEAESALQQYRLWLDPHRLTAQALAALGPGHARAAEAVQAEVRSLLARMPGLASLTFADGTPFADPQTRAWLENLSPRAGGQPAAGGGDEALPADALTEARAKLGAGQAADGLAALQRLVFSLPAGRSRFRARLALAQAALAAGLQAVALATYEELDREAQAHALDAWEPALAAECLKGLVTAGRALAKDPRGARLELASPYQRLCRLDPAAAHEVWP